MISTQVTVFGANGKVGTQVVSELVAQGYKVVAFVHSDTGLNTPNIKVVQGDIYSQDDVNAALEGSTMVISCLGSWGTPKKDILSAGMQALVNSSHRKNIVKVISLTGADARVHGDRLTMMHRVMRQFILIVAKKILLDGEQHVKILEQSNLNYTIIRSPVMSSRKKRHTYTLLDRRPMPWITINRKMVTRSMIDALTDEKWNKKAPFVI